MRLLVFLHAWLIKGDNEYATGALGHKRTGAVIDQGRLNNCAILMAHPVFTDLLSRERQQDQGEALEPEHL